MGGSRFSEEDVDELRRRFAVARHDRVPAAEESEAQSNGGGVVQLNVRVRVDLKQRIARIAHERRMGFADVIELAIAQLDGSSS